MHVTNSVKSRATNCASPYLIPTKPGLPGNPNPHPRPQDQRHGGKMCQSKGGLLNTQDLKARNNSRQQRKEGKARIQAEIKAREQQCRT